MCGAPGGRGGPSPLCPPTPGRGACGGTLRLCPGLLNSAAIPGVAGIPPDCLPPLPAPCLLALGNGEASSVPLGRGCSQEPRGTRNSGGLSWAASSTTPLVPSLQVG